MFWHVLVCSGMFWYVLVCFVMFWHVLVCFDYAKTYQNMTVLIGFDVFWHALAIPALRSDTAGP